MTATIEQNIAQARARRAPWDVMGDRLTVADAPLRDVLTSTGLDYEVRSAEVVAVERSHADEPIALANFYDAPNFQAIVRPMPDGTTKVLHIPGNRYTIVQNDAAFAVVDPLRDLGASVIGAADFHGGGSSMIALSMPQEVTVRAVSGADDITRMNLIIVNPHDGSGSVSYALTPMRLACTNALPAAFSHAQRTWRVRHTNSAHARVAAAQEAVMKAAGYAESFAETAQAMADKRMTDTEFRRIVERMWSVDDDDERASATRKRNQRQDVLDLYQASETLDGVRGTLWGGYNAVTEYLDHMRPVRVGGDVGERERAVRRAEGAIVGETVTRKERVFSQFAQMI